MMNDCHAMAHHTDESILQESNGFDACYDGGCAIDTPTLPVNDQNTIGFYVSSSTAAIPIWMNDMIRQ
jgi:hypothetical protein